MTYTVAIVGAGVVGMTNAVALLEAGGFTVTIFTKDDPLNTNSDAAVATWYIPDSKPILQRHCLESLKKLKELSEAPNSGVQIIPMTYYFKSEEAFKQSAWSKISLMKLINLTYNLPKDYVKIENFPMAVSARIPLVDVNIYRPFLLKKFYELKGKLIIRKIHSLDELTNAYDIVINSAGWESKHLTNDSDVYPVRGQTEIAKMSGEIKNFSSLNIADMDAYVVYRPQSNDCVLGTTYQEGNTHTEPNDLDKKEILTKISLLFPRLSSLNTISKVGIRCGRFDVRLECSNLVNKNDKDALLIQCYGHGGSGYSASWGSAGEILQHCLLYINDFKPTYRSSL